MPRCRPRRDFAGVTGIVADGRRGLAALKPRIETHDVSVSQAS